MTRAEQNGVTAIIVDCAVQIHMKLGPGLFESVYEGVQEYELQKRGLAVQRQVGIPVVYDGLRFADGFVQISLWRAACSSRSSL